MEKVIKESIEFLEAEFKNEALLAYSVIDHSDSYEVFKSRADKFELAVKLMKRFLSEKQNGASNA